MHESDHKAHLPFRSMQTLMLTKFSLMLQLFLTCLSANMPNTFMYLLVLYAPYKWYHKCTRELKCLILENDWQSKNYLWISNGPGICVGWVVFSIFHVGEASHLCVIEYSIAQISTIRWPPHSIIRAQDFLCDHKKADFCQWLKLCWFLYGFSNFLKWGRNLHQWKHLNK